MLLAVDDVVSWGKRISDLGGWTAVVVLSLTLGLAIHRKWLGLGREIDRADAATARAEKENAELTADRNKWIATCLEHMTIVQKQGEAMERMRECFEDLTEMVEKLADEVRKGKG